MQKVNGSTENGILRTFILLLNTTNNNYSTDRALVRNKSSLSTRSAEGKDFLK